MALVVKHTKHLEHPTEPGAWFDVRLPLSAGDMAGMRSDGKAIGMTLDLLAAVLVAWSYDAPVNLETVDSLDLDTFTWLQQSIMAESGIRDDSEKKDSNGSSSPLTLLPSQATSESPAISAY